MVEESIRSELDSIKADLGQLRNDIAALSEAVKNVAAGKVNDKKDQTRQKAQDAWEDLENKIDDLLQQGRDGVDGVEQKIRDHPGGSLMGAFGLGFIIAKLLDSGGRH